MKPKAFPWPSKIVGYGEVQTESILANEKNWRVHPKTQTDALASILSEVGIVQNILINKRTSIEWPPEDRNVETLCDGHARSLLALRSGQPTLPVTFVDLTPNEEMLIMSVLDPISALAVADTEKLAALLHDVSSGESAIQQMLSQLAEEHGIVPPAFAPASIEEQGRLDQKQPIVCPHCGGEFTP